MKKLLLFSVVAAIFAGCTTSDTQDVPMLRPQTITVGIEEGSRIQIKDDKTVWNAADLVSVFYNSDANDCWQFEGATGDKSGTLVCKSTGTTTEPADCVVVAYPYKEGNTLSVADHTVFMTLSPAQVYTQGSYGLGSNVMVASGYDDSFVLKSVCGWISVQLTGSATIREISLKGNNGERIAGRIAVNYKTAEASFAGGAAASPDDGQVGGTLLAGDKITLACTGGVKLDPANATEFYISLLPQTFENGITVTVKAMDGTEMVQSTSGEVVVSRNTIQPMAAFEYAGTAVGEQPFAIVYTTTDGEPLTHAEILDSQIVTAHTFENGIGTIYLSDDANERYEDIFVNESNTLKTIAFPEGVTKLVEGSFTMCKGLEEVTFPASMKCVEADFAYSPIKCVYIADLAKWCAMEGTGKCMKNGASLYVAGELVTDLVIPSGVSSICKEAFMGCGSIKSVTIPDSVTRIDQDAFAYCPNIESFSGKFASEDGRWLIYENPIKLATEVAGFASVGLTEAVVPEGVTYVNVSILDQSGIESITLPSTVRHMPELTIKNAKELHCKAATPPTFVYSWASLYIPEALIFVPAESVDAYKNAEKWSKVADKICADSEAPEVPSENVQFADPVFKSLLVSLHDADADGELSYDEAAAVTDIIYDNNGAGVLAALSTVAEDGVLTSLEGIEACVNLETLVVKNANIASVDLSQNTKLTHVECTDSNLAELNVSGCSELQTLNCSNNALTELNLGDNTKIASLQCSNNNITSLDVSNMTELAELNCGGNSIEALDLSRNDALTSLECSSMDSLKTVYISEKAEGNIESNIPPTADVVVGDGTAAGGINIPDAQFKAYLIDNGHDTDGDGEISAEEAAAVKQIRIFFSYYQVSSLEGIEHFLGLESLDLDLLPITSLNVGTLAQLKELILRFCPIESLDVSLNAELETLICDEAQLASLDVSHNSKLKHLEYNSIPNIGGWVDVSNNPLMEELWCIACNISSLDVSHNPELRTLVCSTNNLQTIDVSHNEKLEALGCGNNQLTSIDVSNNPELNVLEFYDNRISTIDLSNNGKIRSMTIANTLLPEFDASIVPLLEDINCGGNTFTSLDFSRNPHLTFIDCSPMPTLKTLTVAEGAQIEGVNVNRSEEYVPATTEIIEVKHEIQAGNIVFPDANFKTWLVGAGCDTDGDGEISYAEAAVVMEMYIDSPENNNGLTITSLEGIEHFPELRELQCMEQNIGSLDISKNTKLTYLDLFYCGLGELDVQSNTKLVTLYCTGNDISSLSVSHLANLKDLGFDYNPNIAEIDTTENTQLKSLSFIGTGISSVDLSCNTGLTHVACGESECLGSLDLSNNTQLETFYCYATPLITSLDLGQHAKLKEVYLVPNENLTSITLCEGVQIEGVTVNRSEEYIPAQTAIIYGSR